MSRRWFVPTFVDFIMAALMAWLFVFSAKGWNQLLSDGDTGWHIRTGEWIVANGRVPFEDLFSFTKPGARWFAWEWGADVVFALLHKVGGLPLLVFFCGFLLVATSGILLRWIMWRGSSALVAFPLILLAAGGSTMHYLARPHVFTLFLLVILLWLLDAERRAPSARIWLLIPLTVIWTNLHGGWPALFVFFGVHTICRMLYRQTYWRRDVAVFLVCAFATLANPYGWMLHAHIAGYLSNDWIRDVVDEFQSPKFRAENLLQFELLLIVGIAAAWGRARSGWVGMAEALPVWIWAHLALSAVRHAPIFILAAVPVIASELTALFESRWRLTPKTSVLAIFRGLDLDLRPKFAFSSVWGILFPLLIWACSGAKWPRDFPADMFPVQALAGVESRFKGSRTFTSDQWADYLLYRDWPATKVYIDGRSDFYGQKLGQEYLHLLGAGKGWRDRLEGYRIDFVLLPPDNPLSLSLSREADWEVVYSDRLSTLYRRRVALLEHPEARRPFLPPALMKPA